MDIIQQRDEKIQELLKNFLIYFYMQGADGTEWIDYNLPTPNILKNVKSGIFIGWAIDGHFGTKRGKKYLNDIIARYLLTFRAEKASRLPYKPQKELLDSKTHLDYTKHKLKEFQGLKSVAKAFAVARRADTKKDHVFYALKFFCEDLILQQGIPTYPQLLEFAQQNFLYKEPSTLRAKCRSIFNWYQERDFIIPRGRKFKQTKEEYAMTRKENCKKQNEIKATAARAKVLGAITELQHLGKKINGNAIARITGQNVKTARKWLKEIKENNPQLLEK